MVCLGNICRSPLAHGILQQMADADQLGWVIDSAGTGNWHVGQAPDRRSISIAKAYGVDISSQAAQHFNAELFDQYELIYAMDKQNLKDILAQARDQHDHAKVRLFLSDSEVPDPYYDDALFDPVYQLIAQRAGELIQEWKVKRHT